MLSKQQIGLFRDTGYLLLRNFYTVETHIEPIQRQIRDIICLVARKYNIRINADSNEQAMTEGYPAIIAADRRYGSEIYDAIKQIPSFLQLVADPVHRQLFHLLRQSSLPGVAAGGFGIRIDNPSEEKFRAQWHQEFPGQLRSLDGIVFWSPLLPVTEAMGPVQIAVGSHEKGLLPVYESDKGVGAFGAYALHIEHIDELLDQFEVVSPCTQPGDLLLMDFLTLHQSGFNRSSHARYSMQFRYFNFRDPSGIELAWSGSFAAGRDYKDLIGPMYGRRNNS